MLSVEPVIVYPSDLNESDAADCGEPSVTIPGVPVKTAPEPADPATSPAPLTQWGDAPQVPPPPRPAPVVVLFPTADASASQYRSARAATGSNRLAAQANRAAPGKPAR